MATPKRVTCAICGEYLGEYVCIYPREETCGSLQCDREMRQMQREEEAEREGRAREDHYERY